MNMTPDQSYKRRQYLVDPAYQLQFVSRVFMIVLAVAVVSLALSSVLLSKNLYEPDLRSQTPLITSLVAIATMMLIELLVAIPLVFLLSIRQSHRVVGPMNRMKRMLDRIGEGDFSQRITLRKGDVLEELGKAMNRMADSLQRRHPSSTSPKSPSSPAS